MDCSWHALMRVRAWMRMHCGSGARHGAWRLCGNGTLLPKVGVGVRLSVGVGLYVRSYHMGSEASCHSVMDGETCSRHSTAHARRGMARWGTLTACTHTHKHARTHGRIAHRMS